MTERYCRDEVKGGDDGDFKNLNQKLWFRKTLESTEIFCRDFFEIIEDEQDIPAWEDRIDHSKLEAYLYRVVTLENDRRLKEMTEEEFADVFPTPLLGRIHEYPTTVEPRPADFPVFEPKHLMYKLATIRDKLHGITYELLFEYGICEADVDIYYGIKAVSDKWNRDQKSDKDAEDFLHNAEEFYEDIVKPILIDQRNTSRRSRRRFKTTNNVSNGTYWLFWVRVESDTTIKAAKEDLLDFYRKLTRKYRARDYVNEKKSGAWKKFKEMQTNGDVIISINGAFARLLKWIERNRGKEEAKRFEKYILRLEETKIDPEDVSSRCYLTRTETGQFAFNTGGKMSCVLLHRFFEPGFIDWLAGDRRKKDKPSPVEIPYDLIGDLFLTVKGRRLEQWERKDLPKAEATSAPAKDDETEFWQKKIKTFPSP